MNYDFEESGKRDHVNINDFDVLNRISSIINSEFGSNDAAIARYLIAHIRRSSEINVATITRDAFVTRSAVRRFCNRLGYQSLSDLKESFTQSVFPSDLSHREEEFGYEEYRAELDVRMIEMFAEVESGVSDIAIKHLADEIDGHKNVEIWCTNNVSANLVRFQQEMFYAGKIVRIVAGANVAELKNMGDASQSLIILVSVSGLFASQAREYLDCRSGRKILITAFSNDDKSRSFDRVYRLGNAGNGIDRLGVYSKYAMTYFFDLLSSCYLSRYPCTKGEPLYSSPVWRMSVDNLRFGLRAALKAGDYPRLNVPWKHDRDLCNSAEGRYRRSMLQMYSTVTKCSLGKCHQRSQIHRPSYPNSVKPQVKAIWIRPEPCI